MRMSLSRGALAGFAGLLGLVLGLAIGQVGRGEAIPATPGAPAEREAPRGGELARIQREYAPILTLEGTARQEILAIARLLERQPGMAIDFSTAPSRQYCLAPGAGSMVHFAIEPRRAPVDIVYFHDAGPLLANGLDVNRLPPEPAAIADMKPGVWYYNDGSRVEPFHSRRLGSKILVMGVAAR